MSYRYLPDHEYHREEREENHKQICRMGGNPTKQVFSDIFELCFFCSMGYHPSYELSSKFLGLFVEKSIFIFKEGSAMGRFFATKPLFHKMHQKERGRKSY
jgi:hypothetical protein